MHTGRLWDGAYYLAGYAVECAIKACIAKTTNRHDFPEKKKVEASHTHNLRELVRVAGLEQMRASRATSDAEFRRSWEAVQAWSEQSRYERYGKEASAELLDAVSNRRHGVYSWIKLHW